MDPTTVYLLIGVNGVGVIGLVTWIGRQIGRGQWVPRPTYEDVLRRAEAAEDLAREVTEQNGLLLRELGPTLQKFLSDLRTAAGEVRRARTESGDES
jgi:hypothetical protein